MGLTIMVALIGGGMLILLGKQLCAAIKGLWPQTPSWLLILLIILIGLAFALVPFGSQASIKIFQGGKH